MTSEACRVELEALRADPSGPVSSVLTGVVVEMQASGVPKYEWGLLKPLLKQVLASKLDEFRSNHPSTDPVSASGNSYEESKGRLLSAIDLFQGAPFTLQRLCELILSPGRYYKSVNKLMFGLEKLLSVSSVLEVEGIDNTAAKAPEAMPTATAAPSHDNTANPVDQNETGEDAVMDERSSL
mmetsp:Transcript_12169/g.19779  ORF Transcript_12169/g.19779 Transcript_12169/m.19779 type:complete len:182 (-) Transcript_12169:2354-2899(-)